MRLIPILTALAMTAAPLSAGVPEVVANHALPATERFAKAANALADAAAGDCTAPALRPAYHAAFDAWLGLAHLHFGPVEDQGRVLAIAFWPDKKGMVAATVNRLVAAEDPVADDPEGFAEVSVAGRGLFALERLLFEDPLSGYGAGDYACRLTRAVATDLARMADDIDAEWRANFAPLILTAGQAGNARFLSEKEAQQLLYTALVTGLDFNADQRLGRPLGTFDAPRPTRAEARRSERSLRNIVVSLMALQDFASALADGPIPATDAAFATAIAKAEALNDPTLERVADPQGRFETEIVQQLIQQIAAAVANEIGVPLGVSAGFNASDGD